MKGSIDDADYAEFIKERLQNDHEFSLRFLAEYIRRELMRVKIEEAKERGFELQLQPSQEPGASADVIVHTPKQG